MEAHLRGAESEAHERAAAGLRGGQGTSSAAKNGHKALDAALKPLETLAESLKTDSHRLRDGFASAKSLCRPDS